MKPKYQVTFGWNDRFWIDRRYTVECTNWEQVESAAKTYGVNNLLEIRENH